MLPSPMPHPDQSPGPQALSDLEDCNCDCLEILETARAKGNADIARFAEDRLNITWKHTGRQL
jgi:hypothetical protein